MASNLCMNENGVRGANEGDDSYYSTLMENPKTQTSQPKSKRWTTIFIISLLVVVTVISFIALGVAISDSMALKDVRSNLETLKSFHAPKKLDPLRHWGAHDDGYSYRAFENVETWDKAQAICRQKGGHLPVIRDERMRDFVYNLMGQSHQMLFHGNWLGLTDRQKPGQWLTWDGKEPPFLYWGKGEPNDQGGEENCCVLAENNVMNNVPCGTPEFFYCQIKTDTLIKREAEKYSTKLSNFLSKFKDRKTGQ